MKIKLIVILTLFISLTACKQHKLSPEELISKIEKNGFSAKKGGAIASFAQNSEVQFWLIIEDDKISAYRFDSPETAILKAESFSNGLSVGYWAFDNIDEDKYTKDILKESLK